MLMVKYVSVFIKQQIQKAGALSGWKITYVGAYKRPL